MMSRVLPNCAAAEARLLNATESLLAPAGASLQSGRTGDRANHGKVHMRWHDGIDYAMSNFHPTYVYRILAFFSFFLQLPYAVFPMCLGSTFRQKLPPQLQVASQNYYFE